MLPASAFAVREDSSIIWLGPPDCATAVITLSPGSKPRSTCSGRQSGARSSHSPKHIVYLPGQPIVARSVPPGRCPATLRITSRTARPMVAFAR